MNIDRLVFAIGGLLVLVSVGLSQLHSVHWLWLTAFVGANMLQSAFTGLCPMARFLHALGRKPGRAFD